MRLKPEQRRSVIITAAVRIAQSEGLASVNHSSVAKRCTVQTSSNTVKHYFKDRDSLWLAVIATDPDMEMQGKELGLKC